MTETRILIDRLTIGIVGLPAAIAEPAGALLQRALQERLGSAAVAISERALAAHGTVALGAVDAPAGADPAALAGIIAERLVAWLSRAGDPGEGA